MIVAAAVMAALHVLPRPDRVEPLPCRDGAKIPRTVSSRFDAGALDELNERWNALGIGRITRGSSDDIHTETDATIPSQGYRLTIDERGVRIASSDADGAFAAAMTLAQLPQPSAGGFVLPCVRITDAPALRWRILSDDVSRGPLPTMRYFKERIRTIAAFKMNGYSPYMEHVFVSTSDPLPAPPDGITPAELRALDAYARRFHVALVPEQQTFAHMHGTLRVETYSGAAELPHGFLLSPNAPLSQAYLTRILREESRAVPGAPFFHVGSDETSTLGAGQTAAYVAAGGGRSAVYAAHVRAMAQILAPTPIMIWDDGIESDPSIAAQIPKSTVVINWHYGDEPSYQRYIATIASGGLRQMVSPGGDNWNQLYPDVEAAVRGERRFIAEGKAARVLGLFQNVWHDDGETLYESTWYPLLYAAASAWETGDVDPSRFAADFPRAFFGTGDAGFSNDIALLAHAQTLLNPAAGYPGTDRLFWADPFDAPLSATMNRIDLRRVRLDAEGVETHLHAAIPPLHRAAAAAMDLAARRYDALGRRYQIAREVRAYYDDARAQNVAGRSTALRDLLWCKYWFWEQRDSDEAIAPLYAQAWRYESREGHLPSNMERYHLDAQRAIARADAIERVTYDQYVPSGTLPALESVLP